MSGRHSDQESGLRKRVAWLPHAIIAIDVAVVALLAVHLAGGGAIVNNAIDIWFDRSDPAVQTLAEERRLFGADTWMLATVWMRADRVNDTAAVSRALTSDLERLNGVARVISPTSLEVLHDSDQGLFFDALDADLTWPELRDRLARHPVAANLLVHPQSPASFSLLIKEHTGPATPGTVRQQLVLDVRRILDGHPAVSASAVAGTAVLNADLNRLSWRDFTVLVPGTVVVASLVLLAMLRFRWRTTLAVLLPVGLATAALVAAMVVSGRPFTMVTIALPGLFFTLGIASSLHVVGWIATWLREGRGTVDDAAVAARRELARPVIVSHVTTALGFGLLAVIPVTPVQEMALFGAAGELFSGLHVLFVMPLFLKRLGALNELVAGGGVLFVGEGLLGRALAALAAPFARLQRARARVMVPVIVVSLATVWLVAQVRYDSTYLHMIDESERLRIDYARFDAAQLPSAQLSVVIRRAGGGESVDAALNSAIAGVTADIEALTDVAKVVGPAAVFNEVAPALAGAQPLAAYAADDLSVTDAYIFALSGGNTEIGSYVHDGLSAYRLVVFFPYLDNSGLEDLTRRQIPAILARHFGGMPNVSTEVSGITVLWANMDNAISSGQIASVAAMAIACFATFFVSLRNWRLAACAMFVNVLPVAMIGAVLGATGRPIDMATVFIMGISLGIAVDDTSFFVHGYLERGRDAVSALAATLRHSGPTMVATCVVILIGFSVLLASSFTPMRTFGGLTAIGLVLAMVCDVLVLPFLLLFVADTSRSHHHADTTLRNAVGDSVTDADVIHAG
jgi:predicted RND superfamily exporter protein